ncbi:hypothetical protein CONCODRAFT_78931, partial [Conidiobolus coronatus NRRL 28638]
EVIQTIVNGEQVAESKVEEHNSSQLNGDSYITAESSTSSAHNAQESKDGDFMEVDEPVVLVPQSQTPPVETAQQNSNPQPEGVSNKSSPASGGHHTTKSGILDISQFRSISRPKSRNGCTIPQSPYFATNHRIRSRNLSIDDQAQTQTQNKPQGVPQNKPLAALAKKAATKPMSPKFSKLHNKSRQVSQNKLSPKALRNKYTFKNPKYQTKNPIKVKEFKFLTDKPRQHGREEGSPSDAKPNKHLARVPKFPPPVPFRPGQVPTTVPKPFHFASDIRFGNNRGRLESETSSNGSNNSRKHLGAN